MRIGYAKFGRSMGFNADRYRPVGDPEAPQLLRRLATSYPDVEWSVIGVHTGIVDMPPNVVDPWPDRPRARVNQTGKTYRCTSCGEALVSIHHRPTCCTGGASAFDQTEYMVSYIAGLDGVVMHLGQHGTSSNMIPQAHATWDEALADHDQLTHPQVWSINYAGFLVRGMNALGDRTDGQAPVTWLCPDPRNYLCARDFKWPTGTDHILAQGIWDRDQKHERWRDPRPVAGFDAVPERNGELWVARHRYRFGDLEMMGNPDDWATWGDRPFEERAPYGIATTSGVAYGKNPRRSEYVRDWLLTHFPYADVYGPWTGVSLDDVANISTLRLKQCTVVEFPDRLGSWRSTLALPAPAKAAGHDSWTTAKPYQAWAARTACFMVPPLDTHGWTLPVLDRTEHTVHQVAPDLWSVRDDWTDDDLVLARWLRVRTPEQFAARAHNIATSRDTWTWITDAQRSLLARRWNERLLERTIGDRHGL